MYRVIPSTPWIGSKLYPAPPLFIRCYTERSPTFVGKLHVCEEVLRGLDKPQLKFPIRILPFFLTTIHTSAG